jgi:hypothetical protein
MGIVSLMFGICESTDMKVIMYCRFIVSYVVTKLRGRILVTHRRFSNTGEGHLYRVLAMAAFLPDDITFSFLCNVDRPGRR